MHFWELSKSLKFTPHRPQLTIGGIQALGAVLRRCHQAARRGGGAGARLALVHIRHREAAHPNARGRVLQSPVLVQPCWAACVAGAIRQRRGTGSWPARRYARPRLGRCPQWCLPPQDRLSEEPPLPHWGRVHGGIISTKHRRSGACRCSWCPASRPCQHKSAQHRQPLGLSPNPPQPA